MPTIEFHKRAICLVWENSIPDWAYRLAGSGFLRPRLGCYGAYENCLEWRF